MRSLFTTEVYNDIISRLDNLEDNAKAQWGKMDVAQMAWHCQGPFNIILGKNNYGMKPNWLAKVFFKKSLYNDKPWRKGLPTAKFLKTQDNKDFISERTKLKALIDEAYSHRDKSEWKPHPAFGYFTADQWGELQYKHLDHHLKQFGV